MKLLVITQKVDKDDDGALGFVHNWIRVFSEKVNCINVICLMKGKVDLSFPILSLGKEDGKTRLTYVVKLYTYLFRLHNSYDTVFVHMNVEYILLAGLWWKLTGKKIILWYNHTYGSWKVRLAMRFADILCHTSPYAFTAGTTKSRRMPAGIDVELYKRDLGVTVKENSILSLGRIAPVKNLDVLIKAALVLDSEGVPFTLNIYGEALSKDKIYEDELKRLAIPLLQKNKVYFGGKIENWKTPKLYSEHAVFVNLTPRGNYDKTILEALACESLSVVSSDAFNDVLSEFTFKEEDPVDLARVIKSVFQLSEDERRNIGKRMREYVIKTHGLNILAEQLFIQHD